MRKVPTLFRRETDHRITPVVAHGCEWVALGEGVATRKYDGTCCLVRGGKLYKRAEVREGKPFPDDFELEDVDHATGKSFGWVPVGDGPSDQWHREAWETHRISRAPADGTYELVGPKVQGNPEKIPVHTLVRHGASPLYDCPRDFAGLREYLGKFDIEGVVWHHPDGRMAKIKGRDFGLKRPALV